MVATQWIASRISFWIDSAVFLLIKSRSMLMKTGSKERKIRTQEDLTWNENSKKALKCSATKHKLLHVRTNKHSYFKLRSPPGRITLFI